MSSYTVYAAIAAWFAANWSSCPVYYENAAQLPTSDEAATLAPWMYVELIDSSYAPGSIGAGSTALERWVEMGTLNAHIFMAAGETSSTARMLAEALANALRGLELWPSIRFRDLSIGTGATADNGNWWGITVRANWIRN